VTSKQAFERLGVEPEPRRVSCPFWVTAVILGTCGFMLLAACGLAIYAGGWLRGGLSSALMVGTIGLLVKIVAGGLNDAANRR